MHRFANPARFQRIANAVLPWFAAATALLLTLGLYFALFDSPADYQQGETVRIMYVHVPSAWMALFVLQLHRCRQRRRAHLAPSPGRRGGALRPRRSGLASPFWRW